MSGLDRDEPSAHAGAQSLVALVFGGLLLLVSLAMGAWALLAAAFGTVLYGLIYTAAALAVVGIALIVWAFARLDQ